MRRPRSTSTRIAISVAIVTVLFWPIADYKWSLFKVRAYDPATGANPVYVAGPVGDITASITEHTWWICLALPEAVFGALAAIGVFILLNRFAGTSHPRETLCRRCGRILRDLRDPQCPTCGEHL